MFFLSTHVLVIYTNCKILPKALVDSNNIYSLTVSLDQEPGCCLAEWFCLWVSCEVAVKTSARAASPEALPQGLLMALSHGC